MSDHILKTIEQIESGLAIHEQALADGRSMINKLCVLAGLEPKYSDTGSAETGLRASGAGTAVRPDEFFNKPLASCVRDVLNRLKASNRAPASVEAIYDVLQKGGFDFPNKARDTAIQGLAVSIGKNSALFVKLPSGLIGVKEWYGQSQRPRGRAAKENGGGEESGDAAADENPIESEPNPAGSEEEAQ